ncbi:MAG: hypothetical protein ACOC3J_04940 [Gemmatimonadota bacterium]
MPAYLSPARALLGLSPASRRRLEEFRRAALRRLIRHAYERVPYYRRLFDERGVDPASVRDVEDLGRIPVSPRGDLRSAGIRERVARGYDADALCAVRTSGSTGEPLNILRTPWESQAA